MGKIGYGYGSEWHLLWYLGRHRANLSERVKVETGAQSVDWLDFATVPRREGLVDGEWKGLDFLADGAVKANWREFWPPGAGIQNWDAVATLRVHGRDEWLLVEAKGHCGEIESSCGAKPEGGLEKIRQALDTTKRALGVAPDADWLNGYYQYCNRVAVLHFLQTQGIPARLLFIYFTGDSTPGCGCPADKRGWMPALAMQEAAVGLPQGNPLGDRIHKLFLPVFRNMQRASVA